MAGYSCTVEYLSMLGQLSAIGKKSHRSAFFFAPVSAEEISLHTEPLRSIRRAQVTMLQPEAHFAFPSTELLSLRKTDYREIFQQEE